MIWFGMIWYCMIWYCMERYGMEWYLMAHHGMVKLDRAWDGYDMPKSWASCDMVSHDKLWHRAV